MDIEHIGDRTSGIDETDTLKFTTGPSNIAHIQLMEVLNRHKGVLSLEGAALLKNTMIPPHIRRGGK